MNFPASRAIDRLATVRAIKICVYKHGTVCQIQDRHGTPRTRIFGRDGTKQTAQQTTLCFHDETPLHFENGPEGAGRSQPCKDGPRYFPEGYCISKDARHRPGHKKPRSIGRGSALQRLRTYNCKHRKCRVNRQSLISILVKISLTQYMQTAKIPALALDLPAISRMVEFIAASAFDNNHFRRPCFYS